MAKCQFRKNNGSRCGANSQAANGLCVFHDPARAVDGQKARQAGGLNRSRPAKTLPPDTPDHSLASPKDVSTLLAESINQLRRGELDPKVANAVGYLSTVLLRALEQGPLEDQYFHGRSIEDMEFFCAHGYLPEIPIPGPPYEPIPLSWEERWAEWKKHQRIFARRTDEEREYFCVHGQWPPTA